VVLLDRGVGDVVGPERRRQADRDQDDEGAAEGERDLVATQAAGRQPPGPETRLLRRISGRLSYSSLFRQKRE
jgi:hypothetical protein